MILALSLGACSKKKSVGYQGGPPPPPPTEAPVQEVPAETNDQGGVTSGPRPTAPGPVADGRPPRPTPRPAPERPPTPGVDAPEVPPSVPPEPVAPVAPVSPVEPTPELTPWFPPDIEDGPAQSWLHYNIRPVLGATQNLAPAPLILPRRVKITLALGYFDGFHQAPLVYEGRSYGRHVPVDPWLRAIVERVVTEDCRGQNQLCGFEKIGDDGVESLFRRAGRDAIIQDLRVVSAALSTDHEVNTGREAALQQARSAVAKRAFLRGFSDSDLVIYVGHSRLGGGPDFFPPRLKSDGTVNYPHYQRNRPGVRAMVEALREARGRRGTVALVSCDSTDLFLQDVRRAAPDRPVLTVRGIIASEDLLAGGLAVGDLFLRQGHLNGINGFLGRFPVGRQMTLSQPGAIRRP